MSAITVSPRNTTRLALLLAASIVAALVYVLVETSDQSAAAYGGADGKLGGEFTLNGIDGEVSLSDFRGKIVVMYFGFLNCQEVCLNSMTVLQTSLLRLPAEQLDQVRVLLVSIDPERDSNEDLAEFTRRFHENIIGLRGSQREIDAVTADYGAHYEITDADRNDPGYLFRHSSRYYVINQAGELVDAMRHSTTPNELITRIRSLM